MRTYLLTALCLAVLAGCDTWKQIDDGGVSSSTCVDFASGAPPDMAVPCDAAKGLTGDNLLCVNFANTQTTLPILTTQGWKFDAFTSGNCAGWQSMNSLLQVTNFSGLNGACGLTLPPITAAQIQKYGRLTLSIQQRIDLNDSEQQARIYLNDDTDPKNVMWQNTAVRNVTRQQTVITIDSADLPVALKTGFKWFLKMSSIGSFTHNGWQIESIAINGNL